MSFRRNIISLFLVLSIVSSSFLPVFAAKSHAGIIDGVASKLTAAGLLPHVPTGDTVQTLITTVLNLAAKAVAQALIAHIVNATIRWANTGFEGGPAYVTDRKQFFANSTNSIVGNYINSSKLGFLCTPFQNQIRISLANNYKQAVDIPTQCTFTGIAGNLQDFYSDFSSGGWKGWFSMTQNPTNNPYDAYLSVTADLGSRIQSDLNLKQQDLQINDGFLSTKDCLVKNPDQATLDDLVNKLSSGDLSNDGWYPISEYNTRFADASAHFWDETKTADSCILYGPVKTPGKQIEDKINQTLGSGFAQLVNAKQFDDLISALMGGLIERYVLGSKGLFSKHYSDSLPSPNNDALENGGTNTQISCTPSVRRALVGDTVTWSATGSFAAVNAISGATSTYSWIGDDAPGNNILSTATSTSISVQYLTPGLKTATVSVASTDPTSGVPQVASASCDAGITVSKYPPLSVSCSAVNLTGKKGQIVSWKAVISGGSGNLNQVYWQGDESTIPGTHIGILPAFNPTTMKTIAYNEPGVVVSGTNNSITASYGNYVTTQSISSSKDSSGNTVTTITLSRPYTDSGFIPGNKSANITVIDSDPNTDPQPNVSCTNQIFISN